MGYVNPYMVWSPWFGYKSADDGGRGTSGQRDGQGQITEGHAGMPKNWTLKLGLKGATAGFSNWAGAQPD